MDIWEELKSKRCRNILQLCNVAYCIFVLSYLFKFTNKSLCIYDNTISKWRGTFAQVLWWFWHQKVWLFSWFTFSEGTLTLINMSFYKTAATSFSVTVHPMSIWKILNKVCHYKSILQLIILYFNETYMSTSKFSCIRSLIPSILLKVEGTLRNYA